MSEAVFDISIHFNFQFEEENEEIGGGAEGGQGNEVKWALGNITTNKASGDDGIPVELFEILKDDALKVLRSICQQIWIQPSRLLCP